MSDLSLIEACCCPTFCRFPILCASTFSWVEPDWKQLMQIIFNSFKVYIVQNFHPQQIALKSLKLRTALLIHYSATCTNFWYTCSLMCTAQFDVYSTGLCTQHSLINNAPVYKHSTVKYTQHSLMHTTKFVVCSAVYTYKYICVKLEVVH